MKFLTNLSIILFLNSCSTPFATRLNYREIAESKEIELIPDSVGAYKEGKRIIFINGKKETAYLVKIKELEKLPKGTVLYNMINDEHQKIIKGPSFSSDMYGEFSEFGFLKSQISADRFQSPEQDEILPTHLDPQNISHIDILPNEIDIDLPHLSLYESQDVIPLTNKEVENLPDGMLLHFNWNKKNISNFDVTNNPRLDDNKLGQLAEPKTLEARKGIDNLKLEEQWGNYQLANSVQSRNYKKEGVFITDWGIRFDQIPRDRIDNDGYFISARAKNNTTKLISIAPAEIKFKQTKSALNPMGEKIFFLTKEDFKTLPKGIVLYHPSGRRFIKDVDVQPDDSEISNSPWKRVGFRESEISNPAQIEWDGESIWDKALKKTSKIEKGKIVKTSKVGNKKAETCAELTLSIISKAQ
jgi:hypothetical protein